MPESQQTKLCKYCKIEIPKDAKVCPNCKKRQSPHGCLIVLLVAVVLIVLIAIAGGGSETSGASSTSSGGASSTAGAPAEAASGSAEAVPQPTEAPAVYGPGDTAEDNGIRVTLVNAEITTGSGYSVAADGNIFVVLEFEVENESNTDISVSSMLSFEAYCDDYAVNQSLTPLTLYPDQSSLDGSVAAGRKLNGLIAYEVPADFQNLDVTFTPSFWGNRSVTFSIPNA